MEDTMNCPFCCRLMTSTYHVEDDKGCGIIMRRVVEYNECENLKCGAVITVVIPLLLKETAQ